MPLFQSGTANHDGNPWITPRRKGPSRASIREGEYEGDLHVDDAIRCVACIVAAGIFRVPRCRWADSPFADNRRHFFGHALLQGP